MKESLIKRIFMFYIDGFRSMTLGRTLWLIIAIKLFILFFVFKLFFFKSELGSYENDQDKSNHVIKELTLNKK